MNRKFKGWALKGHTLTSPNGTIYDIRHVPDVKGERASGKIGGKIRRIYRIIWSVIHGADLPKWVEIHHVNHNHVDCRPSNLVALNHEDHVTAHKLIINMMSNYIDGNDTEAARLRAAYLDYLKACEVTPEMLEQ